MSRGRGRDGDLVTPAVLLRAYAAGIFPMADSAENPTLYWVEPKQRGILALDAFHLPRRLARTVRSDIYEVRIDSDFNAVIDGCAAARPGRRVTWINGTIRKLYGELFRMGHVHSVEAWADGEMVGGLYGLKLGSAFFGESMFSTARDASKVALVHLVGRLRRGGFRLLDTQFLTEHLAQFNGQEIERAAYAGLLEEALGEEARFEAFPEDALRPRRAVSGAAVLAEIAGAR